MSQQYSAFTLRGIGRLNMLITEVDVGFSESRAKVLGLPCAPTRIKALWDTGASTSSISGAFADRVGIPALDFTRIHGAGGVHDSRVFRVDLTIPGTQVHVTDVQATEFVAHDFDMLIGMDIITLGDFSVTNADGKTVFSFRVPPDIFPIDYVAMVGSGKEAKAAIERFKKKQKRR